MGSLLASMFTSGGAQWHETLPFVVGLVFVVGEIAFRYAHARQPIIDLRQLGYMLSEGIAICLTPIYFFASIFNPALASEIAAKSGKVLAWAMFVAFITLLMNVIEHWRGGANGLSRHRAAAGH